MISIDFQAHGLLSNPSVNEGGRLQDDSEQTLVVEPPRRRSD